MTVGQLMSELAKCDQSSRVVFWLDKESVASIEKLPLGLYFVPIGKASDVGGVTTMEVAQEEIGQP